MAKTFGLHYRDDEMVKRVEAWAHPERVSSKLKRMIASDMALNSSTIPVTAPKPSPTTQKTPKAKTASKILLEKASPEIKAAVERERKKLCDHAGTQIGSMSGVGECPKCGKMVTQKELR